MIRIADNLHALDARVSGALAARDPAPLRRLTRRLVAAGAQGVDLNPGHLPERRPNGRTEHRPHGSGASQKSLVITDQWKNGTPSPWLRCQRQVQLDVEAAGLHYALLDVLARG